MLSRMRRTVLGALILTIAGTLVAQQRGPAREIVNVKGDIYRARNNNYFSLFMVTPEGIILADPINAAFATWMKDQFAERFKVPVRYVVYSHSHWDHIEGGAVFADTARFVAHENVARNMDGRIPQMPGDMLDRNRNGRFELEEIVGPLTDNGGRCGMPANFFRTADRNGDGSMTPRNCKPTSAGRTSLFRSHAADAGRQNCRSDLSRRNHSDDATVLVFPGRTRGVCDRVHQRRRSAGYGQSALVPQRVRALRREPALGMDSFLQTVESLDFDIFAGGHGAPATKSDVTANRQFFEELVAAVSAGMAQGKTLARTSTSLMFEKYKDRTGYAVVVRPPSTLRTATFSSTSKGWVCWNSDSAAGGLPKWQTISPN